MSQRVLAQRAGTAQSVVARIENGQTSPTWETLSRLVAATGLALEAHVGPVAPSRVVDEGAISKLLAVTPRERIAVVDAEESASASSLSRVQLDAPQMIEALAGERVRYVVVGAVAARLYGSPRRTNALDIVPVRVDGNLNQLATALQRLNARLHIDGVPDGVACELSAATLARARVWHLITGSGRIDLRFDLDGVADYTALESRAERFWIDAHPVAVASLHDLMLSKEAVDRPPDRADHATLRALLSRRAKP